MIRKTYSFFLIEFTTKKVLRILAFLYKNYKMIPLANKKGTFFIKTVPLDMEIKKCTQVFKIYRAKLSIENISNFCMILSFGKNNNVESLINAT